jgi:thiol-disulfide isomerase/thioredoxin
MYFTSKRFVKNLFIAMVIAVPVFLLKRLENDSSPSALVKLDVVTDMVHVIKKPASRYHADGPNDQGVTWAVFFHKPYCGACRRLRPALEALASSIETGKHLRFASIDCVQYVTQPRVVHLDSTQ